MKRAMKFALAIVIVLAALEATQLASEHTMLTSSIAHMFFRDNLHAVREGRLYRAAQMRPQELHGTLEQLGIKTVIDLRLGQDDTGEEEEVRRSGANYVHVPLRGSRVPSREEIESLLKAYDNSELPILVHCSSGTHRSGVASAIWLLDREGDTDAAEDQLTAKYGFFRLERSLKAFVQGHPTIDSLIWSYLADGKPAGLSFRDWLRNSAAQSVAAK